ncbi:MAG: NDP-sugar synthase [Gemmatimonadales bacterium]
MISLVILAGGLGSRFGGLKQLEPMGPDGEVLLDYAVYDAARAGIERVVFVIRPEMADSFPGWAEARFGGRVGIRCAIQRLDDAPVDVPPGRVKPWGTAHAVMTAAALVDGPCMLVNADDFYGRQGYEVLARALREPSGATVTWHLAAWPLGETLSPSGTVNRALCEVDEQGWLRGLEEARGLARETLSPEWLERPISMNMWGFTPRIFDACSRALARFFHTADLTTDECLLPDVVRDAITGGEARVRVHRVQSIWCGVTYPADVPATRATLAGLHRAGDYPARLWP